MTNKDKLHECFYLHLEIERLECQINELKEMSTGIRSATDYSAPAVKTSYQQEGSFEDLIIKSVDYERELNKKKSKLIDKQKEVEEIINTLDSDLAKVLFKYRYINGYEFKAIAKKMHYSLSHIYFIHEKYIQII